MNLISNEAQKTTIQGSLPKNSQDLVGLNEEGETSSKVHGLGPTPLKTLCDLKDMDPNPYNNKQKWLFSDL